MQWMELAFVLVLGVTTMANGEREWGSWAPVGRCATGTACAMLVLTMIGVCCVMLCADVEQEWHRTTCARREQASKLNMRESGVK